MAMELKHLSTQKVMEVTGKAIDEISRLRAENATLKEMVAKAQGRIADLESENAELKKKLSEEFNTNKE